MTALSDGVSVNRLDSYPLGLSVTWEDLHPTVLDGSTIVKLTISELELIEGIS